MGKRVATLLLSICFMLCLSGCWNYRGLDQLSIVVGMAIDLQNTGNEYSITYEVADLVGAEKKSPIKGKLITSQGKTLFETARNAKRNQADKLFFGSSRVLVLSERVIAERGILPVIEWFLRDGECRETTSVAISREKTAQIILQRPEEMAEIMSVILSDIIREDKDISATALYVELYELYNRLNSPRKCAVLPALQRVKNGKETISGVYGVAVVKKEGLAGFLTPEQAQSVLLVESQMNSGIITLSMTGGNADDLSLEVFGSKSHKSFTYEDGKLTFHIQTHTKVAVGENQHMIDMMDREELRRIEEIAGSKLEQNVRDLLGVVQKEMNADIFGFGEMIYQRNFSLWKEIEDGWDQIYRNLSVEVSCEVEIVNSAFTR